MPPKTEPRRGDWMQTATGRAFWPLDPRAEEVSFEDIASALSKLCRYNGHTNRFYSVAEHSVLLSRAVSPGNARWALMHDAAEAYVCDVPRPLKPFLPGYKEIEAGVMRAVCARFNLPPDMPEEVSWADAAILADEKLALMRSAPIDWNLPYPPLGVRISGWVPWKAETEFFERAGELFTPDELRDYPR